MKLNHFLFAIALILLTTASCGGKEREPVSKRSEGSAMSSTIASAAEFEEENVASSFPLLRVRFEEKLVIGDSSTRSPEGLLQLPRFIRTDRKGWIYVADLIAMGIKVYDAQGRYRKMIGARGRAPGELLDITTFHIDLDDVLIVADQLNKRIVRFDTAGSVLRTHPMDATKVLWPRYVDTAIPGEYVFLYLMPDGEHLFHVFDDHFQKEIETFGLFRDHSNIDEPFVRVVSGIFPGKFWFVDQDEILFAPGLYEGVLSRYKNVSGRWKKAGVLRGYASSVSYKLVASLPSPRPANGVVHTSRSSGKLQGTIENLSEGVFALRDGRIVHFYASPPFVTSGRLEAEVFTAEGTLIGHSPVKLSSTSDVTQGLAKCRVAWKDVHDRFYLIDERAPKTARVVTLEIERQE